MPRRAGPQPGEKCRVRRNASSAILNLPSLNRHCARPSLTSGGALECVLSAYTPHCIMPHIHQPLVQSSWRCMMKRLRRAAQAEGCRKGATLT